MTEENLEEHCRGMQRETLGDKVHELKKCWFEFFVAISICNTVVVVDSLKSMDSAGSNCNQAFDDSTISAIDVDQYVDSSDSPGKASAANANGSLNITGNLEPSISSEPSVIYTNRKVYGGVETSNHTQRVVNGGFKEPNIDLKYGSGSTSYLLNAKTPKLRQLNERPKYEAESPDEEALVKGAYHFGYVLTGRLPGSVRLRLPNGNSTNFELLHTIGFDSARKRMSIIVRNPDGKVQLFCKGADTIIMNRLCNYSGNCICIYHSKSFIY